MGHSAASRGQTSLGLTFPARNVTHTLPGAPGGLFQTLAWAWDWCRISTEIVPHKAQCALAQKIASKIVLLIVLF